MNSFKNWLAYSILLFAMMFALSALLFEIENHDSYQNSPENELKVMMVSFMWDDALDDEVAVAYHQSLPLDDVIKLRAVIRDIAAQMESKYRMHITADSVVHELKEYKVHSIWLKQLNIKYTVIQTDDYDIK